MLLEEQAEVHRVLPADLLVGHFYDAVLQLHLVEDLPRICLPRVQDLDLPGGVGRVH